MGKHGDDQQHHINGLPSAVAGDEDTPLVKKWTKLRCILVLLFSAAVFLSAVFWLPPFVHYADQKNLHFNSKYKGHDIVASLYVKKPVSLLEDNNLQLSDDIFEEIGLPFTKVKILSLDPLPASIITKVVFAVDPDGKSSEMSPASISLIRETFKYLVMGLLNLQLTPSLFGTPSFFQVLKFKGGITIIPQQNAFPLQTVQTLFNFTLNFSIYQLQSNFGELTSQLKSGLHLASYEVSDDMLVSPSYFWLGFLVGIQNLYVILSNSEGSTVAAPTIVQSSVLLAVGITPSTERLKQLAQTITEHHSWNLGLNNTEFGRVKKVRLSSILQHSLHGSGSVPSPSPAPLPHPHRSHHHRPRNHHHNTHILPATSPAPETEGGATPPNVGSPNTARSVPAPRRSYHTQPPNCQFGYYRKRSTQKAQKQVHLTPAVSPTITPHNPVASPKSPVGAPTHVSYSVPALSPLSNVAFAHNEPHTRIEPSAEHSNTLSHGPSPASSSAGCLETVKRTSSLFVALVLLLLHA